MVSSQAPSIMVSLLPTLVSDHIDMRYRLKILVYQWWLQIYGIDIGSQYCYMMWEVLQASLAVMGYVYLVNGRHKYISFCLE